MTYQFRPSPHLNPHEQQPDLGRMTWPGDRRLGVCLTFEVWSSDSFDSLMIIGTTVDFAIRRGVTNVLDLLARHGVSATFFVNGITAERYPERVAEMHAQGHDVAPLGYRLNAHWDLSAAAVRDDVRRGVEAIRAATGVPARGWRTPESRLSTQTLPAVLESGLDWDSSIRNDETASKFPMAGGSLIEIPFGGAADYSYYSPFPGPLRLVPSVMTAFQDELEQLRRETSRESRMAVLNFNPSYAGRPGDMAMLNTLLADLKDDPDVWFGTCSDIADHLRAHDDWFAPPSAQVRRLA
jgi:peptidoglycan/xylan/chitin deacetylase (PgdA/CDA1 family)